MRFTASMFVFTLVGFLAHSAVAQQGMGSPSIMTFHKGQSEMAKCTESVKVDFGTNPMQYRCKFSGKILVTDQASVAAILVQPGLPIREVETELSAKNIKFVKVSETTLQLHQVRLHFADEKLLEYESGAW